VVKTYFDGNKAVVRAVEADLNQENHSDKSLPLRICAFSPDADASGLNQNFVVGIPSVVGSEKVQATFLTNSHWVKEGSAGGGLYVMTGAGTWRTRVCRKLLQVINKNAWIPPFFGFLAVRLCETEIIESLLGCDPDIIVCSDPEWARQLDRLLRRRTLPWRCVTPTDSLLHVNRHWRKYDPCAKVSIVLPTYNGSKFLRQSIESCLCQTHVNLELVIVDDGSSEDIQGIVGCYKDLRIKYFRHPKNLGLPRALNTGFKHSTGDYLTWTSDDNYYVATAIEDMVRFLQTYSGVDFVYAESFVIDERVDSSDLRIRRTQVPDRLSIENEIGACFLYRRKVYETVGEYDPAFVLVEDYEYWLRVAKRFRMQRLFRPLLYYRYHKDGLTMKFSDEVEKKKQMVRRLRTL